DDGAEAAQAIREEHEHLTVAFVAMAALGLGFGLLWAGSRHRPPDIVGRFEPTTTTAPDEPFIRAGVDQLAAGRFLPACSLCRALLCHQRLSLAAALQVQ